MVSPPTQAPWGGADGGNGVEGGADRGEAAGAVADTSDAIGAFAAKIRKSARAVYLNPWMNPPAAFR
jgi:hypothetical protein